MDVTELAKEAARVRQARAGRTCKMDRAAAELRTAGSPRQSDGGLIRYPSGIKTAFLSLFGPSAYGTAAATWAGLRPQDRLRLLVQHHHILAGEQQPDEKYVAVKPYLEKHYPSGFPFLSTTGHQS